MICNGSSKDFRSSTVNNWIHMGMLRALTTGQKKWYTTTSSRWWWFPLKCIGRQIATAVISCRPVLGCQAWITGIGKVIVENIHCKHSHTLIELIRRQGSQAVAAFQECFKGGATRTHFIQNLEEVEKQNSMIAEWVERATRTERFILVQGQSQPNNLPDLQRNRKLVRDLPIRLVHPRL